MKYVIVLLFTILLSTCAIKEVIDLSTKSGSPKPPRWDMKFDVPLIEKIENLSEYFAVPNIITTTIDVPPFQMFFHMSKETALNNLPVIPGLIGEEQDVQPTVLSQPISIDLNGNGENDVSLTAIRSSTGYMEIIIDLTRDGVPTPLNPGDIAITSIEIEGVTYDFVEPRAATKEGKLVFRTRNFLSDLNHPIRPDAYGEADKIDLEIRADFIKFNTRGKSSPLDGKDLTNPMEVIALLEEINNSGTFGDYQFTFEATFSFGTDYVIEGKVANETELFKIENQTVPLTESQNLINDFTIRLETDNKLPIGIEIKNAFFSNEDFEVKIIETFADDSTTDKIDIPIGFKTTELGTDDSIFNKGSLGLNLELVIPENADLRITDNMYIKFIMGLSGKGQIDLNFF